MGFIFCAAFCAACGFCACAFGMWAFLKGQESMAEIISAGRPANLKGPAAALRENAAALSSKKYEYDMERQFKELFGDGRARGSKC